MSRYKVLALSVAWIVLMAFSPTCNAWSRKGPQVVVIDSPNLGRADTVLVWSPKKKAKGGVKNLFLLHGWGGNPRDWGEKLDMQALCDRTGFRIICPDGFHDSWYINKGDTSQMKWRDFFWKELWPLIDEKYGLESGSTFIDGLSMGGHGAMNIYLDSTAAFRGAGSMSGVLDLKHSGGSRTLIPPMLGAKDIDDTLCTAQSAVNRLERALPEGKPFKPGEDVNVLVVSCGTYDKTFLPASTEFAVRCRELGIRVIELYSPAKHRWSYWSWVLEYHLQIFKQIAEGESSLGWGE